MAKRGRKTNYDKLYDKYINQVNKRANKGFEVDVMDADEFQMLYDSAKEFGIGGYKYKLTAQNIITYMADKSVYYEEDGFSYRTAKQVKMALNRYNKQLSSEISINDLVSGTKSVEMAEFWAWYNDVASEYGYVAAQELVFGSE